MTRRTGRRGRYLVTLLAVVALVGVPGLGWMVRAWPETASWAIGGFAVAVAIGVAVGVKLVASFGQPGAGVLAALVSGMLARLATVLVGAIASGVEGRAGQVSFLAGFALGFVATLAHELVWFVRTGMSARTTGESLERRG